MSLLYGYTVNEAGAGLRADLLEREVARLSFQHLGLDERRTQRADLFDLLLCLARACDAYHVIL
jgi:hypothetical protein